MKASESWGWRSRWTGLWTPCARWGSGPYQGTGNSPPSPPHRWTASGLCSRRPPLSGLLPLSVDKSLPAGSPTCPGAGRHALFIANPKLFSNSDPVISPRIITIVQLVAAKASPSNWIKISTYSLAISFNSHKSIKIEVCKVDENTDVYHPCRTEKVDFSKKNAITLFRVIPTMTFIHFLTGFYPTMGTCFTGWWLTSSLGVWVRQLGWWNSQYMGKRNSCSKPPSSSKWSTGLRYPLVICYSLLSLLLNMAIEIVDLPSYNMLIFHSYVNVYQRVDFSQPVRQVIEELWTLVQVQPRSQRTALKGPDRASPQPAMSVNSDPPGQVLLSQSTAPLTSGGDSQLTVRGLAITKPPRGVWSHDVHWCSPICEPKWCQAKTHQDLLTNFCGEVGLIRLSCKTPQAIVNWKQGPAKLEAVNGPAIRPRDTQLGA